MFSPWDVFHDNSGDKAEDVHVLTVKQLSSLGGMGGPGVIL